MPMLGSSNEPWPFTCSFNLASCRQRAETLARQFHANFWSPRSSFSSDGGSRCVSPSFGFISPVALQPLVIVDRPSIIVKSLKDKGRVSSLDDDDEDAFCLEQSPSKSCDGEVVVSPPEAISLMSPPKSPQQMTSTETHIASLSTNGGEEIFCVTYRGDPRDWMPDSPPESFGSESLPSESPVVPTEHNCSITPISSNETASEISSPTAGDFCVERSAILAHELCSRLKQFESLQLNGGSAFKPQAEYTVIDIEMSETNGSETDADESKAESSRSDDSHFLLSPDACPRLIRSTSLKTGKTPPDTPNRKKYVRFADALGLDLEAVRHFIEDDDLPLVPQSAFADLKVPAPSTGLSLPWVPLPGQSVANCQFLPLFKQPAADPYFLDRVRQQKVCLENLMVNDMRITAVVRVLNLGYEKQVVARYTTTEWASHADLIADYVPQSCDGFSDKFTFTVHLPHLSSGQKLSMALKYIANGQVFWDNNNGQNYVLRVQMKSNDTDNSTIPRWSHHFM